MMDIKVTKLDGTAAGEISLSDEIFGLEPRGDILHRMVRWQLAKRQAGTHKSKGRSEVSGTTKKMYKQKGTGGARHGARLRRSSAAAARPSVRWCAAMRMT